MNKIQNKNMLAVLMGIVVLCFSFFSLFQFHKNISNIFSLLNSSVSYPTVSILEINKYIKDITAKSETSQKQHKAVPCNKESKNSKGMNMVFFLMGALLITNEKMFLIMLMALFAGVTAMFKRAFNWSDDISEPPDMQYYQMWRLKFITPMEKCLESLAQKYDVNPICFNGMALMPEKNPHFIRTINRVRVFFMSK